MQPETITDTSESQAWLQSPTDTTTEIVLAHTGSDSDLQTDSQDRKMVSHNHN